MNSFEKLKTKLSELFQLDQVDLDFGIYRIMNARRDEINQFLEKDLRPRVREAFSIHRSFDKTVIQTELDRIIAGVNAAGMDPERAPRVKELRLKLAEETVDVKALENEVYDHLYSFFNRYYDEGDFISLRRYKEGVYAIPYEGEEVKLHWANHDQYYIKTTECFRDYAFKTPNGHRVHFKIVEADTEKDNTKATNGVDRRFLLHDDLPPVEENGELVIRFEYRPDGEKRGQDVINAETTRLVIERMNNAKLTVWKDNLTVKWKRADGVETAKSILEKHLFDYTRRNTFDYFIHKDLGGFLRRELDFYIKSEVMRLDDVEEESVPRVEQYLSKIKVIRRIAHAIIDFLAQIENFQKKLWLKKKFVIETNYCMTIDRAPEEMYPEIAANEDQREEWVRIFAIDEIQKDLAGAVDYSEPLTVEFLKANPFLTLDTKHFNQEFKDRLIESVADLDGSCQGLLLHAENFHALRLLQRRCSGRICCTYIDPPYNTGEDEFPYKDSYQHSSWLSMYSDRLQLARGFLQPEGSLWCSLDDNELARLLIAMNLYMGENNFLANVLWQKRTSPEARHPIGAAHDYIVVYAKDIDEFKKIKRLIPLSKARSASYTNPDNDPKGPWASVDLTGQTGHATANQFYKAPTPGGKTYSPPEGRCWALAEDTFHELVAEKRIWFGKGGGSRPRLKKYLAETNGATAWTWWTNKEVGHNQEATKELNAIFGTAGTFETVKPSRLLQRIIKLGAPSADSIVMDYFSGSGTTGHAVINLNREDGGSRKYILVEMGDHFDTIIAPRIKKVIYSNNWKNGKPVHPDGVSHMFKYIRLESYEDALANIELRRTAAQQSLLDNVGTFRESYLLKYMLDVEARGSRTLINIDDFDDPWSYKLLIGARSVGETTPVNVDLVETFNWLLGLTVKRIERIRPTSDPSSTAGNFQVVEGESPRGEKILIIWRKIRDRNETDPEKITASRERANRELEAFIEKRRYNAPGAGIDIIYVNGDNNVMNIPLAPDRNTAPPYMVRLIEEEFTRLMFDGKES